MSAFFAPWTLQGSRPSTFTESFSTEVAPAAAAALRVTVSAVALGEGGECIKVELLSFCTGPFEEVAAAAAAAPPATFRGLSAGEAAKWTTMSD